jgi:flagellin
MPQVINTNISSLNAQRQLNRSQMTLQTSMERLSSGLRINSAKDDAAGLAISDRMTAQIRGLNQAVRNANDGISLAQVAEGALQESTNILQRMRELAVQSANDSNSASDRVNLQKEVNQLQAELNRIANTTTFNGKKLLDGTFSGQEFQVGAFANQSIQVTVGSAKATDMGANTLSNDDVAGAITEAVAGAANNVAAGTLTINGYLGTGVDVTVGVGDTARTIADGVNAVTDQTGVSARAVTYAKIDNVNATGIYSLDLNGQNTASAVTISASITDTGDLTELANAINGVSGKTGITAELSSDKSYITLKNAEGYDIHVANSTDSAGDFDLTGLEEDGETVVGTAATLTTGADATVGGNVIFESAKSFSIDSTDAALFAAETGSSLSDVGSVDIGSQKGALDALAVLDGALAFIADTRADLGAIQNRFSSTISNLENVSQNISAARSRVQDADFAKETAELSRSQILQQAGTAMLAQANAATQNVLSLLRG